MKNKTTLELGMRLKEIRVEVQKLWVEQSRIFDELKERFPHLKNSPDLQPKKRERKRYEKR